MRILTVVSPFASYALGAQLTDPAAIADALAQHPEAVVASDVPDPPPQSKTPTTDPA